MFLKGKKGDIIIFDDLTPEVFDCVCKAIFEIENNYPYEIMKINSNKKRVYAIAKTINN